MSAWACTPNLFKGEQRINRSTGLPEWEVEIDTKLGRLWPIVSAATNPFPGLLTDDEDQAVPVEVEGLAIVGWDEYYRRPRLVARVIKPANQPPSAAPVPPKAAGANG